MRGGAAALALLIATGCRTTDAPVADAAATAAWPRHILSAGAQGAPGYSVAMPPDWVRKEVRGIDSEVAEFEGSGLRIFFDYGWYGGFAECAERPTCRQWEERIAERDWRLSTGPMDVDVGGPYRRFLSAHVRLGGSMTLAVGAACVTQAHCERALAAVRTVRFER